MTAFRKLFAAALVLSLPLSAVAQAAAAPAAAPAPAAEPAKPAAPAEPTVKVTPYGFVLLNSFWANSAFAARDYPATVIVPNTSTWDANRGGSFAMSARQSRFGVRLALKDDNWTGAEFTGTVEFDFKAGHLPGNPTATTSVVAPGCTWDDVDGDGTFNTGDTITCTAPNGTTTVTQGTTTSNGWNAGLMRLRIASATALWKTPYGNWSILAGQDYGLVNPLFAESVSYVADPIFWQAGNYWRRSPQIRLNFATQLGMVGVNVAAAMLAPADNTAPVDFGSGGRSRTPDLEARAALSAKIMPDVSGTIGVGYHTNKRRYNQNAATEKDVTASVIGVDADLNLTKFLQVKGEYYTGEGIDDTYNGIAPTAGAVLVNTAVANDFIAIGSSGFWAQAIVKPIPQVSFVVGYGKASLDEDDLKKVLSATAQTSQRLENTQLHAGAILNAGKFWRVGLEMVKTETEYVAPLAANGTKKKFDATHYALSSMFRF